LLTSVLAVAQEKPAVEVVAQVGHSGSVDSVAISPDGRLALSGSRDVTLKLWNLATGKLLRTFEANSDAVMSVAFSPDGRTVLSGSYDGKLKLWDATAGKVARTFEGQFRRRSNARPTNSRPAPRRMIRRTRRTCSTSSARRSKRTGTTWSRRS